MPLTKTRSAVIKAITSCVPSKYFDNVKDTTEFDIEEVKKVVRMAGVEKRHIADDSICSSDLCISSAKDVMRSLDWSPESIDALIFVTQSPDYFLPSTACLAHRDLGLSANCAAFDVGLGCSGYPYGLWLASMMLQGPGFKRVLLLHGETPTRFANSSDRAVALLFGDGGSATAIETSGTNEGNNDWFFSVHTDGTGYADLIIEGGGFRDRFPADKKSCFVHMNGANIFNFTIKRVPSLVEETLEGAGISKNEIDYFIFHQSNRFIMSHLAKKMDLPKEKLPMTIGEFGSAGGPSVPLTVVNGGLSRPTGKALKLLLLGYGVGLSWGSALVDLSPEAVLNHLVLDTDN